MGLDASKVVPQIRQMKIRTIQKGNMELRAVTDLDELFPILDHFLQVVQYFENISEAINIKVTVMARTQFCNFDTILHLDFADYSEFVKMVMENFLLLEKEIRDDKGMESADIGLEIEALRPRFRTSKLDEFLR